MAIGISGSSSASQVTPWGQESVSKRGPIKMNFNQLEECYGIKPDEEAISTWARNKIMPIVSVGDFRRFPISLKSLKEISFEGNPPISFTFKEAVRFVVDLINQNAHVPETYLPLSPGPHGNIARDFYDALINIDTKRPDLVPEPPQYEHPICSAEARDNTSWLGVILRLLLDQGHISAYGKEGSNYWISL